MLSYVRPLRRTMGDGASSVLVDYPLRFSVGIQQQTFYNFPGDVRTSSFRPVLQISLF
jgi:hypothetical protein